MGLITRLIAAPEIIGSLGRTAREMAEVFTPNANRAMELEHEAASASLAQFGTEFLIAPQGLFDRVVNGLNRLPRPLLALGTLGLFTYAMVDPESFAGRMQGLSHVPEPLWWLLGAIVAFYFGARETHYRRIIRVGAETLAPQRPAPERAVQAGDDRRADPNPAAEEYGAQAGNR